MNFNLPSVEAEEEVRGRCDACGTARSHLPVSRESPAPLQRLRRRSKGAAAMHTTHSHTYTQIHGKMPPIKVKFEIPYFTVSGLQVRAASRQRCATTCMHGFAD